eukprot:363953-Chlamydomonas_euryale.AAC.9
MIFTCPSECDHLPRGWGTVHRSEQPCYKVYCCGMSIGLQVFTHQHVFKALQTKSVDIMAVLGLNVQEKDVQGCEILRRRGEEAHNGGTPTAVTEAATIWLQATSVFLVGHLGFMAATPSSLRSRQIETCSPHRAV